MDKNEEAALTHPVEQQASIQDVPAVLSPNYQAYYCNNTQFFSSNYDFRIVFSNLGPGSSLGAQGIQNQAMCSVGMSYEHAKALAIILGQTIREREKEFGPLFLNSKSQEKSAAEALLSLQKDITAKEE